MEEHKDETIDVNTFVDLFRGVAISDASKQQLLTKAGKIVTQVFQDEFGGYHSYSSEEKAAFVDIINSTLRGDPDLEGMLPINPDTEDLFPACGTGVLLCKLINNW